MIKVMKFGGSSMGSVDALKRTASIIQREPARKAVVVSAMSGVTNSLIACMRDRSDTSTVLEQLRAKYAGCAQVMMSGDLFNTYLKNWMPACLCLATS